VIKIPKENTSEILNVLPTEILPCELIKPTINGMLERWQGESRTLNTPHPSEASTAIQAAPISASYKAVKIPSIILVFTAFRF